VLGVCLVCHLGLVGPDTGNNDTRDTDVEAGMLVIAVQRTRVSVRDLPPQVGSLCDRQLVP